MANAVIVFSLRTWSPNEVKIVSKWQAARWRAVHRDQKIKTMRELGSARGDDLADILAARAALANHRKLSITLHRFAPSSGLDDDNLRGALKWVRDAVAEALGVKDDRDPRYIWNYMQGRGAGHSVGITLIPIVEVLEDQLPITPYSSELASLDQISGVKR